MAAEEITMSMRAAADHLRTARKALRVKEFYSCVFHSASAGENAANALILSLGGVIPRTHRDAEAMREVALKRSPELLREGDFRRVLEKLRGLEKHVVMSRYPIEVKEGKYLPPHEYYKRKDAERALEDARFVVEVIKRLIDAKKRGSTQTEER